MIVCLGKSADVKTGYLSGQEARRCARQESEPPYELRSRVMPVEQRAAGRQKRSKGARATPTGIDCPKGLEPRGL